MSFTVALVGRPNVGKSTLFNRLTGTRHALVDDRPGVTRDRRYGDGQIGPMQFRVIDTAGMEESRGEDALEARMLKQTEAALNEADVALMLIDGLAGLTPDDEFFARWLRKQDKPVVIAVNKAESKRATPAVIEAFALGLGEPVAISAEHGEGLADLYAALEGFEKSPESGVRSSDDNTETTELRTLNSELYQGMQTPADLTDAIPLSLAIIGRPNAGKSTLLNALVGSERVLTGPEAGLTRDSIAVDYLWRGKPLKLVDTAGLRKQAKRQQKLERLSAMDSFRAIQYAQVVVLLLDATSPLDKQDFKLAEHVIDEGRALVIAVNKWDLVPNEKAWLTTLNKMLDSRLPAVRGVPLVTCSALKASNLDAILKAAFEVYELWNRRIPTGQLNRWLDGMMLDHPPPLAAGARPVRLKYMTQIKTRPPTFVIFATRKEKLPESYRRYLIHGLRQAFDLPAVPIRLQIRGGKNPYADE